MKTDSSSGLVRALGPLMAIAVVVGTVIGSGVFKKPQVVAENIPYFGMAATVWVLGGVLAFLGALALAEVAVLFPKAGGNYVFLREGYGRLAGFLWGWVEFWIIRSASLAALATIFTESLYAVLREVLGPGVGNWLSYWPQRMLTVLVILGLALVNVRGVRWGGVLQLFITTVKVASLVGLVALPFVAAWLAPSGMEPAKPTTANLRPTWPEPAQLDLGMLGRFTTALLAVMWAYHGWMNIAPVAEEVRQPQRNIPLALLGGVGIVMALYLGANLAYCLVLPQEELAKMKEGAPVTTASGEVIEQRDRTVAIGFTRRLIGTAGVAVAAAAVMCSVFGALNGNLLVGPRLLYAMGEDGLAPKALSAIHPHYHTPALAIVVMAVWAALLVVGVAVLTQTGLLPTGKDHFDVLTDFAMFGAVIFETMAVASIFVFRWKYPAAERPYRCWGYPVVPALYVFFPALVLGNMFVNQQTEAVVGVAFIVLGAVVYQFISRRSTGEPIAA
jgi:amino acid transporter